MLYLTHRHLAEKILETKNAQIERSYIIWMYLRQSGNGGWFNINDTADLFSAKFGIDKYRLRKIIKTSNTLFWHTTNNGYLKLIGKWEVFKKFEVDNNPGKVYSIPEHCYETSSIQKIRATLMEVCLSGTMQSRFTQSLKWGRVEQTYINYQRIAETKPIANYSDEEYINPDTGEVMHKRLSNSYPIAFDRPKITNVKKYGWKDTVGIYSVKHNAVDVSRKYFKNEEEYRRFRKKGWIKEGSTVYIRKKYKKKEHKRGDYQQWRYEYIDYRSLPYDIEIILGEIPSVSGEAVIQC